MPPSSPSPSSPSSPSPSSPPAPEQQRSALKRYIPVTLVTPLIGVSLGVDGGAIFQILAIDNLGLSATAIGIAFGLGVASLPIQLFASRIPIERARRNMQIFFVLAALQAWLLAFLVGIGATGGFAAVALGVTIAAEISVSVLYATAWQPLLSSGVDTLGRQRLSTTWSAIARGLLAGALLLFDALDSGGRSAFLVAVGALAIAAAVGLNAIDPPAPAPASETEPANSTGSKKSASALAPATRVVLVVFAAINIGAIPLWLVYLNKVLWPSVNLGAIGAVQIVASMAALFAWKSTDGDVTRRALAAAAVTLAAAASIVALDGPVDSAAQQMIVVVATAAMAGGVTTARVAMLEATHRVITPGNTVRAFTLLDVVASTSLQVGLLVSGFLITASVDTESSLTDPYRAFVLLATATTIPAMLWFRKVSSQNEPLATPHPS